MSISKASGYWAGTLKTGEGAMKPENAASVPFSRGSRFDGQKGSNPEELVGAALSGCFSMALSAALEKAGITPERIDTRADVKLEQQGEAFTVTRIDLRTEVRAAASADAGEVARIAEITKKKCPIGKLFSTDIGLEVRLVGRA